MIVDIFWDAPQCMAPQMLHDIAINIAMIHLISVASCGATIWIGVCWAEAFVASPVMALRRLLNFITALHGVSKSWHIGHAEVARYMTIWSIEAWSSALLSEQCGDVLVFF
jgi:hypothetical protein